MKHAQTFRTLNKPKTHKPSIVLVMCVAILLAAMCGAVLVYSWPANMEADYRGFGLLGAFVPVVAVLGAFCVGMVTAFTVRDMK